MSEDAVSRARELLRLPTAASESEIATRLINLIEAVQPGLKVLEQRQAGDGRYDGHVAEVRFIFETKTIKSRGASSKAGVERGHDQLHGYVNGLRRKELDQPPLTLPGFDPKLPWTGLLTDGRHWSAWRWDHDESAGPKQIASMQSFVKPEALINFLDDLIPKQKSSRPWIPLEPGVIFEEDRFEERLKELHDNPKGRSATARRDTSFRLWERLLETSGMTPDRGSDRERLFVKQTFLVVAARCSILALDGAGDDDDLPAPLKSDGFHTWVAASREGEKWLLDMWRTAGEYEWRHREGDIMRSLYDGIIPKEERKLFGEYYTPDWLAGFLAEKVLDDAWIERAVKAALRSRKDMDALKGIGVLDPACGSGSFLVAAASRIRDSKAAQKAGLTPKETSFVLSRLLHGIDIHPIAVELARANLRRFIGATAGTEDEIGVHIGDSLQAGRLVGVTETDETFKSTRDVSVRLPQELMDMPDFRRKMEIIVDCANEEKELDLGDRPDVFTGLPEEAEKAVRKAHDKLREIIREEGNSVWAWYAVQHAAIERLRRRKVDRILANPPWVRMNEITNERRRETLENLAGKPGPGTRKKKSKKNPAISLDEIWPGGKNATSFDICQIFIHRCRMLFLAADGKSRAGWLANAAARTTDAWAILRAKAGNMWKEIIDLSDMREKPFTGANSCAILYDPTNPKPTRHAKLLAPGKPVSRGARWSEAKGLIKEEKIRTAAAMPSDYAKKAKNGATIQPRILSIVDESEAITHDRRKREITLKTKIVPQAKPPWNSIDPLKLTVPEHWITRLLNGADIFPFACIRKEHLSRAVIPLAANGRGMNLDEEKYPRSYREACQTYKDRRGKAPATPKTLPDRLDFHRALSSQLPLNDGKRHGIVYPKSGANMKAALWPKHVLVDNKAYILRTRSLPESFYLLAILNAPSMRDAFANARKSDRHFDTAFWDSIPIPIYNSKDALHRKLADIAEQAEAVAQEYVNAAYADGKPPKATHLRQAIETKLRELDIAEKLDGAARKLLPGYAADK